MYKIFFLIIPLLLLGNLSAQSKNEHVHFLISNNHYQFKEAHKVKTPKAIISARSENDIKQMLVDLLPNITNENQLILEQVRESLTAKHYYYEQTFDNISIYQASVRVSINKNNEVISLIDNTESLDTDLLTTLSFPEKGKSLAKQFLASQNQKIEKKGKPTIFINSNGVAELGYQYYTYNELGEYYNLIFNSNGKIVLANDRSVYHAPSDSTVNCSVFLPDPLTTSQNEYGFNGFSDNNDTDSFTLNSERKSTQIKANFNNGIFSLENDYVQLLDRLPPTTTIATSNVPIFDFTRNQKQFEDVNVFYHITAFQNYVQSLGINNLQGNQIKADAHSLNGSDNSRFIADGLGNLFLDFGDGGVDDAEDADVIIHEYIHALSYMASASNVGHERNALDEALGDYFATSYSRSISEYRWYDMFTWDGHNEFWSGRSTNTNKKYPDDLSTNIYATSEIFSSCLMRIYEDIGREALDLIVLESLFYFAENMTLQQVAETILDVEMQLFDGQYRIDLLKHFFETGLTNIYEIDAGENKTICLGEQVTIGANNIEINGLQIQWIADQPIKDANSFYATVSPSVTSDFILKVINPNNNVYTDTTTVTVEYCSALTDDIILINAQNFMAGLGDIFIQLSENTSYCDIKMFDTKGSLVHQVHSNSDAPVRIYQPNLIAGVYIINVESNKGNKVFKVIKAK